MDPHSHTIMLQCAQPDRACLWAGFPAVVAVPPTKVVLVSDDTNAAWRHHLFDRLFAALATAAPGDPDPEAFSWAGDGAATRMLLLVVAGHGPPSPELTDLATQWQARGSDALGIVPGGTDPRHVLPPALHRKHAVRWYRDPDETVPELLDVILLAGEERRVFISYATSDGTALAERLAGILNAQRYDVFLDRFRLAPGVDFYERIEDELVDKAMVVVVETPGALASTWVRYEVNTAITLRLGVVALNLDRQPRLAMIDERSRCRVDDDGAIGDFVVEQHRSQMSDRRATMLTSAWRALRRAGIPPAGIITDPDGFRVTANTGDTYAVAVCPRPADLRRFRLTAEQAGATARPVIVHPRPVRADRRRDLAWLATSAAVREVDEGRLLAEAARIAAGAR